MNRAEKYKETDTFHFHNENPKNRITGDCTFRAIARATGKPWSEVVIEMAELSVETGYAINDKKGIDRYMKKIGWVKHPQPRKGDNTKYTGKEFCKAFRPNKVVANIGGHHVVAIMDGKVNDIWDSTGGCVGNYWTEW